MKRLVWPVDFAGMILVTGFAIADSFEWTGGGDGTSWNDSANWNRTEGTTRFFPNSTSDTVVITGLINDVEITVSTNFSFGSLFVGHPDHTITFTGAGKLTGGTNAWNVSGVVQFGINVDVGNFVDFFGTTNALTIIGESRTLKASRQPRLRHAFRALGAINADNDVVQIRNRLEIGRDNFSNKDLRLMAGAEFSAYAAHRSHNLGAIIDGPNTRFNGANGFNYTIQGSVQFKVPSGKAAGDALFEIHTSRLILGGGFSIVPNVDRNMNRHPLRLFNGGALELTGLTTTTNDLVVDGVGTVLLNNTEGSASGSNNSLILGRRNFIAGTTVTLGGTGSTDSALILGAGGQLDPGNNGIGTLTVNRNVTFEAGVVYRWERGREAGDGMVVYGNLTIADTFTIVIAELGRGATSADIITYSGSFSGNPGVWTLVTPEGYEGVTVTNTGSSIRLLGLPPPKTAGTVIQIR